MVQHGSARRRRPDTRDRVMRPVLIAGVVVAGALAATAGWRAVERRTGQPDVSRPNTAQAEQALPHGGEVAIRVPEELQTFAVATRLPDGGIAIQHATGPKAADALVHAGAPTRGTRFAEGGAR